MAAEEVERWCARAAGHPDAEGDDDAASVSASLVADVAAFALEAIRSADASAHVAAFLALVTELWGAPLPSSASLDPRIQRQRAVLTEALADAVRTHAHVRRLLSEGWQLALRGTTADVARVRASLSAVTKLHLLAASEDPALFWTGHFPLLSGALRSLATSGHEGAHTRKHIVAAVGLLHAELRLAFGEGALPAPRVQPLVETARLLATRDSSAVVRLHALAAVLELETPGDDSTLGLLRARGEDKSAPVRALALSALCEGLDPARASTADLLLLTHRGIFEQDTPMRCRRACRSFLERALTDKRRAEAPADLLARTGMARMLVDYKGHGGGFTGCALYEELFDAHTACAVFNAMGVMPAATPPAPSGPAHDRLANDQHERDGRRAASSASSEVSSD